MKTIEDLLNNYTNTELAYLKKYKIDSYLVDTQKKIENYIFKKRGLTQNILDNLIRKKADEKTSTDKDHCPRCNTDKLTIENRNRILSGRTGNEDKITCNVCGLIIHDKENGKQPLIDNLLDFFD